MVEVGALMKCTECNNSMKAICDLDGSKYRISPCSRCRRMFCHCCLIAADTKAQRSKEGKLRIRKFPAVCKGCYKKYYSALVT